MLFENVEESVPFFEAADLAGQCDGLIERQLVTAILAGERIDDELVIGKLVGGDFVAKLVS